MAQPWTWISSKILTACRIFTLSQEIYRSPRTGKEHQFYLLDSGDWVNVIPLTPDGEVILVKQFRFGTKDFSLEIPGGMVDGGESRPRPSGENCWKRPATPAIHRALWGWFTRTLPSRPTAVIPT